jgi:G3E family GTPase
LHFYDALLKNAKMELFWESGGLKTMSDRKMVPVYMLSGFLGSGKTTFLTRAIDYFTESGRKPAVIMNEIGEVNLDGMLIDTKVPMAEMLSGCICCSIRDDLGATLHELLTENEPDAIFIESTGVANPMEIVDEVTDATLIAPVELKMVITVVDAPHLLELSRTSRGKTFRLMQDQIRCANLLILNKTDLLPAAELLEVEEMVQVWNPHARVQATVYSQVDMRLLDGEPARWNEGEHHEAKDAYNHDGEHHHGDDHNQGHDHPHEHISGEHHHSHDHVMVYTHYFHSAVDSIEFERFLSELPKEVYRAKGVLEFTDTASRYMFQLAYREADFVKIKPQGNIANVAVFIGENFSKETVRDALLELEATNCDGK